ncbi:MAG TPA: Holliday junction resolvase RuvX [Candidatus Limnocylindria bacterium]|nr:Holliday junction resolvase RuvX [Candidatus Limnocylindria bacterium]
MRRLIGLDHGSRRIGVAVGDAETGMAFARAALRRRNLDADLRALADLAEAEGADGFVIGLPLLEDGSEGAQAAAARSFGELLAQAGRRPVAFTDERWTSWQAAADLQAAGERPRRERGELDSAAARLILQQYFADLAAHERAMTHPPNDAEDPA